MIKSILYKKDEVKMMLARNSLSHIYDEITSRKIYKDIKNEYVFLMEKLEERLKHLE